MTRLAKAIRLPRPGMAMQQAAAEHVARHVDQHHQAREHGHGEWGKAALFEEEGRQTR
ncbi:MAG: hypothetical protein M5R42_04475 [Rhodocyclaceae bacterium]|nr:hypothetical protein [Rhodocyclaceae bacterium]